MRRFNGWGRTDVHAGLGAAARQMLEASAGKGKPRPDCPLRDLLGSVPPSRLAGEADLATEPGERLAHAHGQSLPDWIDLRFGSLKRFPDAVAFPESHDQMVDLLNRASRQGWIVIPYGGGTSVVGQLGVPESEAPVLSVSLERMRKLLRLQRRNRLATFQAGCRGPEVERALEPHGLMLGHFPQSYEEVSLGGCVATRSSGQQSLHFGNMSDLFAGGRLISPAGVLDLPPFANSAAGPDLRQLVLGSEGRFGVLSEVTVRLSERPEVDEVAGVFFPGFTSAVDAARELAGDNLPLSMVRISNPAETRTNLAMAGDGPLIPILEGYLTLRRMNVEHRVMGLIGLTGSRRLVSAARGEVRKLVADLGGIWIGLPMGKQFMKNRFRAAYLRNTLWDLGYAVDTLETAVHWDRTERAMRGVEEAISSSFAARGETVHVFSHVSAVYPTGSNLYTSYVFPLSPDAGELTARWLAAKQAASRAIVDLGGTISHQHGVGTDHRPYLESEKGRLGISVLRGLALQFDPRSRLNPGKLFDTEDPGAE